VGSLTLGFPARNLSMTIGPANINGFDMYFEARGKGEPLLLLHGFTGIGADWDLIFPEPPRGFRLILPDLRGHGRSTNPSRRFTFQQAALDVLGLLDHLKIERCKAMGMSAGAKTLLQMAVKQPGRIHAMVLVSAAPWFPDQARAIMRLMTPESHSEEELQLMRKRHLHGDDQIRLLWEQAHAFKDSYDDMNLNRDDLASISARTLIVHGDRDPLYPVELAVDMHRAIPGSRLWVVPDAGHVPVFGHLATPFARTALGFLRERTK
jgi:pimeloyl-ACP methyl ester carboxylesterase